MSFANVGVWRGDIARPSNQVSVRISDRRDVLLAVESTKNIRTPLLTSSGRTVAMETQPFDPGARRSGILQPSSTTGRRASRRRLVFMRAVTIGRRSGDSRDPRQEFCPCIPLERDAAVACDQKVIVSTNVAETADD